MHNPLFDNYLVLSTVTYSVKIYTPNTDLNDIVMLQVKIDGEDYLQTQTKTVVGGTAKTPETEKEGYVMYQTLCFITFPNTERDVENMAQSKVFLIHCKVFGNVVKHCLNCLRYLLNGK